MLSRCAWTRPFICRTYATRNTLPGLELPPPSEWKHHFGVNAYTSTRVSISNPETAAKVADAFVPHGSQGKIIIEAFPGPGQLTRALLNLPKERIQRLIVVEENEQYGQWLTPLTADPRVTVLPMSSVSWATYSHIQEKYLGHVLKHDWQSGLHPQLHYISHLPSTVMGEQLVSQLLRMVPDRQWLFQFGRVPMSFILSDWVWQRIYPPTVKVKCKLSVIAEATSDRIEALPFAATQPYEDHFYPGPIQARAATKRRKVGNPYRTINLIPLEFQAIEKGLIEKWDYCVRRLFIKKITPLKKCLSHLGPGALEALEKKVTGASLDPSERLDLENLIVRNMNISDWAILVKAFDEWPFAPTDLDITNSMLDTRFGEPRNN